MCKLGIQRARLVSPLPFIAVWPGQAPLCLSVPSFPVPTAGHTPPLERTCKDPAASCLKGLVYCGI